MMPKLRAYRKQATLHNSDVIWITMRDGVPDRAFPTANAAFNQCRVAKELYPEVEYTVKPANFWVS